MTTDRRRRPQGGLSATEWRLAVITALGASYVAAWAWLFVASARDVDAEPSPARAGEGARVAATQRPAVFYDRIPPAERPELVLPAGYRLASSTAEPEQVLAMRAPRVQTRRPMRIRTRSS